MKYFDAMEKMDVMSNNPDHTGKVFGKLRDKIHMTGKAPSPYDDHTSRVWRDNWSEQRRMFKRPSVC